MGLLRSPHDDQHIVRHAFERAAASIGAFTVLGAVVGALWGAVDGDYAVHLAQCVMLGAFVGGAAGVVLALNGVPSRDDSSEV